MHVRMYVCIYACGVGRKGIPAGGMCVCMYVCMHVYMHVEWVEKEYPQVVCMYACVYVCMYIKKYPQVCIWGIRGGMHASCLHARTCVCMYACVKKNTHRYASLALEVVCVYVSVYACI